MYKLVIVCFILVGIGNGHAQSLPKTPQEMASYFKSNFNNGNLENLLPLYEDGCVFVSQPGSTITGDKIKEALVGFLSLKLPIESHVRHVYENNGVAMVITDWSIDGVGPDGNRVSLSGNACDIVRKQKDGTWKYVIDNPFGTLKIDQP